MYLSPFDTESSRTYQSLRTPVDTMLDDNKKVCFGGFSGSGSNYAMYKSNCHDLMKSHCAIQWDASCDQYVKSTNPKEEEMFRNEVENQQYPHSLSDTNSCYSTAPYYPEQRITYGINPVLINNVVVPLSCEHSTFPHLSVHQQYEQTRHNIQNDMHQLLQPYNDSIQQQQNYDMARYQQQVENERFLRQQQENEHIQQQQDKAYRRRKEAEEAIEQSQLIQQQKQAIVQEQIEANARLLLQQAENEVLKQQQEEMRLRQEHEETLRLQREQEERDRLSRQPELTNVSDEDLPQTPIDVDVEPRQHVMEQLLNHPPQEQDFYAMMMNPSECKKSACDISKLIDDVNTDI